MKAHHIYHNQQLILTPIVQFLSSAHMATSALVKTLTVPRQSVCSLNGGRRRATVSLPSGFSGMRISRNVEYSISSMKTETSRRRRGTIVCEAQGAALDVPDVKKDTWQEEVIESNVPVLVEFWAPWCGPCRMMHPVIGKLSKSYEGKIKCFKLNTDENQDIATKYGIRSIPTVIIFKDGAKRDSIIGAVSELVLAATIDKFVAV